MEKKQVVVIGSGPAGYTAAIYTSRALLDTSVITGIKSGGQLMFTTEVENFPGFPEGVQGPKLMMDMRAQAERFGAKMEMVNVTAADFSERPFKLWTHLPEGFDHSIFDSGTKDDFETMIAKVKQEEPDIVADAVVVATGAVSRMLGIPGELELMGKGVSTCAVCDAAFFRERVAAVVGGGDSAMEDALALTKFASKVYVIHRGDSFRASKIMQKRVLDHEKIEVLWNTKVTKVHGENKVDKVTLEHDGEERDLELDGFFLAIGHKPMSYIFADQLQMDGHGFLVNRQSVSKLGVEAAQAALTDEGLVAFPSMTSVEGVFAAGDVVDIRYWQAVTAAAQGCMAAIDAERWLESQV